MASARVSKTWWLRPWAFDPPPLREMPYTKRMNSVDKGRIAEAKVVASLVAQGYEVYLPTFGNGLCDLITSKDGELQRVETKYVSRTRVPGSYEVSLRQVRANRAVMTVKKFSASNADVLAVYIAPLDAVVFLAAAPLDGRASVCVSEAIVQTHGQMQHGGMAESGKAAPR